MTRYRVRTFARYAELLGSSTLEFELIGATTTAAEIVVALRSLPGGSSLPQQPLIAVNHRLVSLDQPISVADELALLPPLAGG